MPHTIINDADVDSLISRLSRPLNVADRENFRTAARAALADVRVPGEGSNYRCLKDLQRTFFRRPLTESRVGESNTNSVPPNFATRPQSSTAVISAASAASMRARGEVRHVVLGVRAA